MPDLKAIGANLKAAALVPGLPHILKTEANAGYAELAKAMEKLGDSFYERGVERLVYYSTQWISVLGHSVQAKRSLTGLHVDENWHDIVDLPFEFRIDSEFAHKLAAALAADDYQSRVIDYEGFPVDTGTIVADKLINDGRFRSTMLSCCVYSDAKDTEKLSGILAATIAAEHVPTGVVVVSGLSGRFFTAEIDLREDHIHEASDDKWNRKILDYLASGSYSELEAQIPEYVKACKVDMGFKAYHVLKGIGAAVAPRRARCHAYGAIYGTGAAVVEF